MKQQRSLNKLFSMLGKCPVAESVEASGNAEELFEFAEENPLLTFQYEQADINFIAAYFCGGFYPSALCEPARDLFMLSENAFSLFIHAWLSELPIEAEILSFGRRVIAAGNRYAAENAASDCGNDDTRTLYTAANKVQHEINRMTGFLRFTPGSLDIFTARCAPDHFVLPALGGYFTERFGKFAWAIIDEKRGYCMSCNPGERAKITVYQGDNAASGNDEWENLWRHYHKTINNEDRNNPNLQRQFMPKRYWKYLPEM